MQLRRQSRKDDGSIEIKGAGRKEAILVEYFTHHGKKKAMILSFLSIFQTLIVEHTHTRKVCPLTLKLAVVVEGEH